MNLHKKPLITVITITYNHESFIRKAINGVLSQDFNFDIEYIIANDQSSDNSHQVILDAISKEKTNINFRYYNHSENKGMSTNFIWSLKQARGEYIALCEGDDYWTDPLKLQKQVDFMEANPDIVLTHHAWRNKFQDGTLGPIITNSNPRVVTMMFRNVIDNFPREFHKAPNGDTFLRFMLKMKGEFNFIDGIDPAIRKIHEGCLMGNLTETDKLPRRIETYQQIYNFARNTKYEKEILKNLQYFQVKLALCRAKNPLSKIFITLNFIFKYGYPKIGIRAFFNR
ncbi:MAG: glycosyltransferase involved in cell wall biosynthesis [Sediminicola sp.]|jgi:glycosyltransferase involved in cell wall biosynthesis|tara:strand:+ start:298 stop:1149 length:852 start_codon:yes stop_codon:yes gene_type:complete